MSPLPEQRSRSPAAITAHIWRHSDVSCGQSEGRWLGEPPSAASAGTGWAAEGSRGRGEEGASREARAGAASSGRAVRGPGAKWHRVPGVEMLSVFPTSNQAGAKVKENRLRAQNFRNNI